VPARGRIRSAPGRFRASCRPALGPVREVLSLDWDRKGRVTPALTTSQEAWPGTEPLGRKSFGREPRWNADRRARSNERAAAPAGAEVGSHACRRSASFFRHCERSEAIQSCRQSQGQRTRPGLLRRVAPRNDVQQLGRGPRRENGIIFTLSCGGRVRVAKRRRVGPPSAKRFACAVFPIHPCRGR
jgi:hypothetical protein